jgi:FkbM family methyltransferase
MKFLLIAKQKKNVDTFEAVLGELLARGQDVTLAIQQRDPERDARLAERLRHERFALVPCPDVRTDGWRAAAPLVRTARDWAQYTRPAYRTASKLHRRAVERLFRELGASLTGEAPPLAAGAGARLRDALAHIERAIPSDALHEEFLDRHRPDVLLVTPGLHFGSGQTDYIKAARARGVPVWMLLFSWDNLSTKGALHEPPDLMYVWNERQRQEAVELHGFPTDRVVVAGAPRFDDFFALEPLVPRDAFFAPLGLDPGRPTLLYLCSSRFIAARELAFIGSWLTALRAAGPPLGRCNVIVRPHPDVLLVDGGPDPEAVTWPGMRQATGWVQRPFDDAAAVVLRTTYGTPQAFYECLHHARAVVALNTSAELEAGIAGRPVYTVLSTDDAADGQANTIHFNYLLREHGGFVHYAPDLATHVAQLAAAVDAPADTASIRTFIGAFLRPLGDVPVAPALAEMLIGRAAAQPRGSRAGTRVPEVVARVPDHAPVDDDAVVGRSFSPAGLDSRPTVRLGSPESAVRLYATPATERSTRRGAVTLPPALDAWLSADVAPGEVLYDIGAGVGAASLTAAMGRNAVVVAFEPGFAAFHELCDNVILNGCAGTVVPLPVALGAQAGLRSLAYPHDAGSHQHALRGREWRPGRDVPGERYTQPVCAETLDEVVRRHRLPPPHALRIALRSGAADVLRGAVDVLDTHRPRSILVMLKDEGDANEVQTAAAQLGYRGSEAVEPSSGHGLTLRLVPDGDRPRPRATIWRRIRRGARRNPAGGRRT